MREILTKRRLRRARLHGFIEQKLRSHFEVPCSNFGGETGFYNGGFHDFRKSHFTILAQGLKFEEGGFFFSCCLKIYHSLTVQYSLMKYLRFCVLFTVPFSIIQFNL